MCQFCYVEIRFPQPGNPDRIIASPPLYIVVSSYHLPMKEPVERVENDTTPKQEIVSFVLFVSFVSFVLIRIIRIMILCLTLPINVFYINKGESMPSHASINYGCSCIVSIVDMDIANQSPTTLHPNDTMIRMIQWLVFGVVSFSTRSPGSFMGK